MTKKIYLYGFCQEEKPENKILHHLCAIRARECWSLWNQGFPMARVLDHYPVDGDYVIELDCDDETPEFVPYLSPDALVIFLIDLLRLELKELAGQFDFHIPSEPRTISFGNHQDEIVNPQLIPNLADVRENGKIHRAKLLDIAEYAACCTYPSHGHSWARCKSIKSILSKIGKLNEINFNVKKDIAGKGKLIINVNDHKTTACIKKGNSLQRIYPNPHGFFTPATFSSTDLDKTTIEIPVNFSTSAKKEPWVDALLRWENRGTVWRNGKKNNLGRDLLGTLCAEKHYAEKYRFSYEVKEKYDKKKKYAVIQIESRYNKNGDDLHNMGIDQGNMDIRIIRGTEQATRNRNEDVLWTIDFIDAKNLSQLNIKPKGDTHLDKKGSLEPVNIGQESLMHRKTNLVEIGITKRILYAHFDKSSTTIPWWENSEWRLQCRHSLQTLRGPPGTGKTWTATQIVMDILKRHPCARILVCSKEHLALDHLSLKIHEKLKGTKHHIVRIRGNPKDDETKSPVSPVSVGRRIVDELSVVAPEEQRQKLDEQISEEGKIATWVEHLAVKTVSVVCTTTLDRTIEGFIKRGESFDFAIIEEAGKCYPSELIGPLSISMNSLLIGDDKQLPPFELQEIKASIKPATDKGFEYFSQNKENTSIQYRLLELTIPHWEKKSFLPIDDEFLESITEWLQPFACIHNKKIARDSLTSQWRMFEELSDSIGNIFYDGPFDMKKINSVCSNQLPGIFREHGRLIFISHKHCTNGGSKENSTGPSVYNIEEAVLAAKFLRCLRDSGFNAVVITPYTGQVEQIQKKLAPASNLYEWVKTVDSFQGKEADFVILSLVRNNDRTGARRRWGFVKKPRRLNVAFSRAREGLAVISSRQHIEDTDWGEDEDHLKKLLDAISERGQIINREELE